jgi:DNA-directed RNA polymerase subunit RPC12/RpoP
MVPYKHFKCNQCGSDLDYAIGMHSLKCISCGQVDPIESEPLDAYLAHDYDQAISQFGHFTPMTISHELQCENCGASFTLDNNVHSEECPYCDMNVVVPVDHERNLTPDGVVPFEIHQHQAEASFKKWLHGLWFAPTALKKKAIQAQAIQGSYMPMWAFDAQVDSDYRGQRGDNYYTTVRVATNVNGKTVMKNKTVTKIRWRNKSGRVFNQFDDVVVMGSHTLPIKFQNFLSQWDLFRTQEYNDKYLSGFRSELYQISLPEGFNLAKEVMYRTIRQTVRRDIGGDHQRIHHIHSTYQAVGFKLLLAPMWISAFNYKQKSYRYVINGQNGKAYGERPWSIYKILGAVFLLATIAGSIYLFSQQ